jgi:two-component system phosphate regulon response regulator OmpR
MVQLLLTHEGFRVTAPENPTDILKLAASERFDVILLDNWMPGLTGVELCRRIRVSDKTTPILFCSGAVTPGDREAAIIVGAQGYIDKPFDPDDLIRNLHDVLSNRSLSSENE